MRYIGFLFSMTYVELFSESDDHQENNLVSSKMLILIIRKTKVLKWYAKLMVFVRTMVNACIF